MRYGLVWVCLLLTSTVLAGCANQPPPATDDVRTFGPLHPSSLDGSYWAYQSPSVPDNQVVYMLRDVPNSPFRVVLQGLIANGVLKHGFHAHYISNEGSIGNVVLQYENPDYGLRTIYASSCPQISGKALALADEMACRNVLQLENGVDGELMNLELVDYGSFTSTWIDGGVNVTDLVDTDGRKQRFQSEQIIEDPACWVSSVSGPFVRDTNLIWSSCQSDLDLIPDDIREAFLSAKIPAAPVFYEEDFLSGCLIEAFQAGAGGLQVAPLNATCSPLLESYMPPIRNGLELHGNLYALEDLTPVLSPLSFAVRFADGSSIEGTPGNLQFTIEDTALLREVTLEVTGAEGFSKYGILFDVVIPESFWNT